MKFYIFTRLFSINIKLYARSWQRVLDFISTTTLVQQIPSLVSNIDKEIKEYQNPIKSLCLRHDKYWLLF